MNFMVVDSEVRVINSKVSERDYCKKGSPTNSELPKLRIRLTRKPDSEPGFLETSLQPNAAAHTAVSERLIAYLTTLVQVDYPDV